MINDVPHAEKEPLRSITYARNDVQKSNKYMFLFNTNPRFKHKLPPTVTCTVACTCAKPQHLQKRSDHRSILHWAERSKTIPFRSRNESGSVPVSEPISIGYRAGFPTSDRGRVASAPRGARGEERGCLCRDKISLRMEFLDGQYQCCSAGLADIFVEVEEVLWPWGETFLLESETRGGGAGGQKQQFSLFTRLFLIQPPSLKVKTASASKLLISRGGFGCDKAVFVQKMISWRKDWGDKSIIFDPNFTPSDTWPLHW